MVINVHVMKIYSNFRNYLSLITSYVSVKIKHFSEDTATQEIGLTKILYLGLVKI